MAPYRIWVAHAAIVLIVGGTLFCIATGREYWPLSQYPMFSGVQRAGPVRRLRLVGVAARDGSEFAMMSLRYLDPLEPGRVLRALETLHRRGDEPSLAKALNDMLRRYEARRVERRHDGPPLRGVRLYRLAWDRRAPETFHAERPDRQELLAEVDGVIPARQ